MPNRIVVLAGGVGGSRFTSGVLAAYPEATVTVVVNTADDITLHGLRVCPDLDTVMYTLGGGNDVERGWGRADETWSVRSELTAYGVEPTWFGLGDRDLATHIVRTEALNAGYPLSEVTAALTSRWFGERWPDRTPPVRLLPMTDDRVETHIVIADDQAASGRRTMHFQEYWVRLHAEPDALAVVQVGIDEAEPAPGVVDAITAAELILVAPSNPVVSIGPILGLPTLRAAVRRAPAPVIGFSPIIGTAPVLGMAHRLLPAIGVSVTAEGVGRHYGVRADGGPLAGGVLDGFAVHVDDVEAAERLTAAGLPTLATDLLMTDPQATARFVRAAVQHATDRLNRLDPGNAS